MGKTFIVAFVCGMIAVASVCYAQASPLEVRKSYEQMVFDGGFRSIDDAVLTCEKHFRRNIALPVRMPPVVFSHAFARCGIDAEYRMNDNLSIEYVGDGVTVDGKNHYMIDIRPIAQKIDRFFHSRAIIGTYRLGDGTLAQYGANGFFRTIVFEKDGWQYRLSVDRRIGDLVSAEKLVDIANSVGWPAIGNQ